MKQSAIHFDIELDEEMIPERIVWSATDSPEGTHPAETKSISLALWDHQQQNTLRIDLWTKDMPLHEMKRFYLDCLGGMAQSIINATGDAHMAGEIDRLCVQLVEYLRNENNTTG